MDRPISAPSLALVVVVLGVVWHLSAPSPDQVDAPNPDVLFGERTQSAQTFAGQGTTASALAGASFSNQSPFAALPSSPTPSNVAVRADERPRQQFEQLIRDYRSGELSPEAKLQIKEALRTLQLEPEGRALIIETFLSSDDPQQAESLYGLVRDADLKEVGLLEGLIQRGTALPTTSFNTRIVDLIADLNTQDKAPYSAVIDAYLAHVAQSPDTALRNAAASQRIWYVAHHQPNNLATLKQYVLDSAPTVREEMYSLIESRIVDQTLSGQAELTLALNTALHADDLRVSADEKARISALLESLTGSGAAL